MLNLNASVIDSRDIIARLEELKDEKQAITDSIREVEESIGNCDDNEIQEMNEQLDSLNMELEEWESDNGDELNVLSSINDEGEQLSSDWTYGETLVSSDYWIDYCRELCEDIGDLPKNLPRYIVIDWEQTAENISADYTTIEIDGTDYYIRSC